MNKVYLCLISALLFSLTTTAQSRKQKSQSTDNQYDKVPALSGLKFRSVGPALTSGRIADFAVNPQNPKEYYVATASGGVWKTVNAGTTYEPLFDSQGSYSIGCVTLDPQNSNVVWVGTGENNNQRSVGYGDGIYLSRDGGKSWKNMGLKQSEHIGSILVDPRDSDVIYVAAIGPLWSAGGERGVYKSTDGGENWNAVLTIDEHTGINEVIMDSRNPDILYATAYQRRRHVFTYLGGGPESGIYRSTDAGATWTKINKGLPKVDMGRIGLSQSPADPDILYAIVEAAQGKGGFYRSTDQGESWEKQGGYSTSGNYYQEIVADPVNPDKIYAMDTWLHISTDGGKTFKVLGEDAKHVDNHCMWINPQDADHFLVGCDGGIYETYDGAKTWQYKPNLPIIQFYKVAVDNAEPFYNIYGGTQDNFSLGGPSRSISNNGIANSEWFVTNGGDGFESQVDPNDPNIVYAQAQYGYLVRYDRKSGERVGIQPKPRKNEAAYRWNWDAPLAISHHHPTRIYFAANKLFRSNDRGNSWEVISDDLTQQIDRNKLEVMGKIWSVDAVAKNLSTSPYGTVVAFSESPLNENLLFVGTDDGLIQVTNDGGDSWTKISQFPGVPERTYVNTLWASQHDEQVVYAAFNHHKYGDFQPYLYKSTDQGRSWISISTNLPKRGSVYAIAEDHEDPNLLFAGTEFGAFFSNNGGQQWTQLKGGLPTIAVRDMAIQARENDLVLGTFGRGFYVLDDYSSLRNYRPDEMEAELFTVRNAWLYQESTPLGLPKRSFQGDSYYMGENLPPVALITYYLKDTLETKRELRRLQEKKSDDNPYPSYENLLAEQQEPKPQLLFTIKDGAGNVVRNISTKPQTGLQRLSWDLRYAPKDPVNLVPPTYYNPFATPPAGAMVPPGTYQVAMAKLVDGKVTPLAEPVRFTVKALDNTTLPAEDRKELVEFQQEVTQLYRAVRGAQESMKEIQNQMKHIEVAIQQVELPYSEVYTEVQAIQQEVASLNRELNNDPVAAKLDKEQPPSIASRISYIVFEQSSTTTQPTQTHRDSYAIAKEEFRPWLQRLKTLISDKIQPLQEKLEQAGAPYTPYALPEISDF
ncbi:MAG: glycosyl hydrolase [Bacteroidota bacterium]